MIQPISSKLALRLGGSTFASRAPLPQPKLNETISLTRVAAMGMVRRFYRGLWVETGEAVDGSRAPAVRAAGVARFSNDTGERSTGEKADSLGNGVSSNVVDASHLRWARREVAASRF